MGSRNLTTTARKNPPRASQTSTSGKATTQKPKASPNTSKPSQEKTPAPKTERSRKPAEKAPAKPRTKVKEHQAGTKSTTPTRRKRAAASGQSAPKHPNPKPRRAPAKSRKKATGPAESVTKTLQEYLPHIKKLLRETTQSVLKNKEALLITFGAVYFLMPSVVKMIVTREEFTSFCLKNTKALIDPSRLKFNAH